MLYSKDWNSLDESGLKHICCYSFPNSLFCTILIGNTQGTKYLLSGDKSSRLKKIISLKTVCPFSVKSRKIIFTQGVNQLLGVYQHIGVASKHGRLPLKCLLPPPPHALFYFFFFYKKMKKLKKIILTKEWCEKLPVAGQNTQQIHKSYICSVNFIIKRWDFL